MVQLNYNGNFSNSFPPPPFAQVRFNFPIIQSDMHVCTGVERGEENRTEAASSESESSVSPCAICVCCVCLSDGEKSEHEDDKLNDTLLNRKFITRWCQKRQKLERSLFSLAQGGKWTREQKFSLENVFPVVFNKSWWCSLLALTSKPTSKCTHYNSFIFYCSFSPTHKHRTQHTLHAIIPSQISYWALSLLFWIRFMSELCREQVRFRRDERTAFYYERTTVSCNGRR